MQIFPSLPQKKFMPTHFAEFQPSAYYYEYILVQLYFEYFHELFERDKFVCKRKLIDQALTHIKNTPIE